MSLAGAVLGVIRVARPQFRSKEDKLTFAIHAYVLTQGYKLVAAGAAAEDEAADFVGDRDEVDAAGWNSLEGTYAFRYQDTEGRRPQLYVKCLGLGSQLMVHWVFGAGKDGQPQACELDVERFTTDEAPVPQAYQNMEELVKLLDGQFGLPLALARVATQGGEGGSGRSGEGVEGEGAGPAGRRGDEGDPLREGPVRQGGVGYTPAGIPAYAVGYEDVVPAGFHAPGIGTVPILPGGPGRGGGMQVGPGHPMFGRGKLGGGVGMPPEHPGLPPGARWDPIGPPGTRGFHPDDFQHRDPSRPHPDMMQPGPGRGTDWDSFFG